MNPIVIDTDLFIDLFRQVSGAKEFFKRIEAGEFTAYCSIITVAELSSASECASLEKLARIKTLLSMVEVVPASSETAFKAGEFRRKYGVALPDALIAATSFFLKARIATRNNQHFSRISEANVWVPYNPSAQKLQ